MTHTPEKLDAVWQSLKNNTPNPEEVWFIRTDTDTEQAMTFTPTGGVGAYSDFDNSTGPRGGSICYSRKRPNKDEQWGPWEPDSRT
jgi:hypothetical protein